VKCKEFSKKDYELPQSSALVYKFNPLIICIYYLGLDKYIFEI